MGDLNLCVCERCQGDTMFRKMAVCDRCGNKRCPGAAFHENECSGSNDPNHPMNAWWRGGVKSDG